MAKFDTDKMKDTKIKEGRNLFKTNSAELLKNKKFVADALAQSLIEGDEEAYHEILDGYLSVVNKEELARRSGIPKATIKRLASGKNVSVSNTLKILGAINQEAASVN